MKALSIKQPWASLIANGVKDIENRTWKTNFRGRIYIHASGHPAFTGSYKENLPIDFWGGVSEAEKRNLLDSFQNRGAIIGEVDIVDCVINHHSEWAEKSSFLTGCSVPIYNWVLANPVMYDKPILNVKGKLSFWDFNI